MEANLKTGRTWGLKSYADDCALRTLTSRRWAKNAV
ncbi:hypothetical protein NEOC65_000465 [Neochlamydia sp. AcF65]|nr:hypothetical protein [Neochlamydia sp. AcF65]